MTSPPPAQEGRGGGDPPRLSATIICLNEEEKIADCIRSVSFADELIVVDSGSTDRTVAIAREMGATLYHNDWPGHVAQKNFALEKAQGQWIIALDADERVSAKLRQEILKALERPLAESYALARKVFYINRWLNHCGWYPDWKTRLVRRGAARWGGENPHDRLIAEGPTVHLAGDLYHLSFDSVSDHLATLNRFTDIAAAERLQKGDRAGWFAILFRPPVTFFRMFLFQLGFLDGLPGFIVSALSAYHVFCKYVKIHMGEGGAR